MPGTYDLAEMLKEVAEDERMATGSSQEELSQDEILKMMKAQGGPGEGKEGGDDQSG